MVLFFNVVVINLYSQILFKMILIVLSKGILVKKQKVTNA